MAGFAFVAKTALVCVVFAMTTDAGRSETLVFFSDMARSTLRFLVRANEREVRFRMIEALGLGPAILSVARCAIGSKTTLMNVFAGVACDARDGRTAIRRILFMTTAAFCCPVRAAQLVVRQSMVERFSI